MSVPDLEPSLAALLRAERDVPGLAPDAKAALWARLEASTTSPVAPRPSAAPPRNPSARGAGAGFLKGSVLRLVVSGLGLLAGAGAVGVAAHASHPSVRASASAIEPTPPLPSATPEPAVTVAAPSPPANDPLPRDAASVVRTPAPTAPRAARPRAPSDDDLGRERALIDAARAAIRAGAAGEGIGKLDEHARAFPRGRMSEERDALRVLALRATGHDLEAMAATDAFRKRYPQSLLLGNR